MLANRCLDTFSLSSGTMAISFLIIIRSYKTFSYMINVSNEFKTRQKKKNTCNFSTREKCTATVANGIFTVKLSANKFFSGYINHVKCALLTSSRGCYGSMRGLLPR